MPTQDDTKLQELILYIADASLEDPDFGMTKLNKILFNADFTSYGRTGQSITDQAYQKEQNGPIVRRMLPAIHALEQAGDAIVKTVSRYGYSQKRVVALREAELGHFSAEEISLVDESVNLLRGMSATRVSDLSHDFPGWQIMDWGENIPYETVFLSPEPLSEAEIARATMAARSSA